MVTSPKSAIWLADLDHMTANLHSPWPLTWQQWLCILFSKENVTLDLSPSMTYEWAYFEKVVPIWRHTLLYFAIFWCTHGLVSVPPIMSSKHIDYGVHDGPTLMDLHEVMHDKRKNTPTLLFTLYFFGQNQQSLNLKIPKNICVCSKIGNILSLDL